MITTSTASLLTDKTAKSDRAERDEQFMAAQARALKEQLDSEREVIKEVLEAENQGIRLLAGMSSKGGSNIPHMAEILQRVINGFGGPQGFSKQIVANYYGAKPGSAQRVRIQEMITRLAVKCSEQGGVKRDLEHMSTADLERELDTRLEAMLQAGQIPTQPVRVVDGEVTVSQPPPEPEKPVNTASNPELDPEDF